jgi:hypothetical protein
MSEFLEIMGLGGASLVGLSLGLTGFRWARFKVRAHRARCRNRRPPEWWITLMVQTDETAPLLYPSVQFRGDPIPKSATLKLELFDQEGKKRVAISRSLPAGAQNLHFALNRILVPEEALLEEVLCWRWDVVLMARRGELRRWHEQLIALAGFNEEAEIGSPRL